jgi:glyoxylase-like metal-dependent hydrolase (beta-lactamase superfamily II)
VATLASALSAVPGCASAPQGPAAATSTSIAATPSTTPPPHRPLADGYDRIEVAGGVYVFLAHESKTPIVTGNSVAIVGDDAALVVDTGQFPELAGRMIADLRAVTDKPVRYVVNTHWHNDHVFGNAVFLRTFPGATSIAHEETARLLAKHGPEQVQTYKTKVGPFLDSLRASLASGKKKDGTPLGDFDRAYLTEEIADGDAALALWKDVELAPPTLTFKDEMTIDLGHREVKLLHFGRGNTAGDAMVYVPDAKVLATGDAVVAPVPFAMGSYLTEWTSVLEKTRAVDATTVVPGHGPIFHDFRYVDDLRALLRSVVGQVRAAVSTGTPKEKILERIDASGFPARFAINDPFQAFAFRRYFLEPAVERATQEANGKLEDE